MERSKTTFSRVSAPQKLLKIHNNLIKLFNININSIFWMNKISKSSKTSMLKRKKKINLIQHKNSICLQKQSWQFAQSAVLATNHFASERKNSLQNKWSKRKKNVSKKLPDLGTLGGGCNNFCRTNLIRPWPALRNPSVTCVTLRRQAWCTWNFLTLSKKSPSKRKLRYHRRKEDAALVA